MSQTEIATLAGGCFWCLEAVYIEMRGVESVTSGYMGGTVENPTYEAVCSGRTGHAEAVQVKFDPTVVSYRDILDVFWGIHDPTTLNRQGNDVGTQYRSVVFYYSPEQKAAAEASIKKLTASHRFSQPIVTQVVAATDFWKAEEYHQHYLDKNGLSNCRF